LFLRCHPVRVIPTKGVALHTALPLVVLSEHVRLADSRYVTRLAQFSDGEIVRILHGYAAEYGLSFVAYWDDGEWHAQMIGAGEVVADAYGGNPREANEALLGMLGLG